MLYLERPAYLIFDEYSSLKCNAVNVREDSGSQIFVFILLKYFFAKEVEIHVYTTKENWISGRTKKLVKWFLLLFPCELGLRILTQSSEELGKPPKF